MGYLAVELNQASAVAVLHKACAHAGLDDTDKKLLRLGENALFHLPHAGLVARISRTMRFWGDATKEVHVANWLASHNFPAAKVAQLRQPLAVDGHPVTFWEYIDGRNGSRENVADLGTLLRQLHSTPAPVKFSLPSVDILERVPPRIESAPVSTADKDLLLDRCESLRHEIAGLTFTLPSTPVHGDAHVQNLIISDARSILIDFERFAWGQPEWDLAMTATEYRTAGWWTDAEYARFVDAYGFDVTRWDGFDVLRSAYEIQMTTWIMQNVQESSEIADEFAMRMKTIRAGHPVEAWKPF